MIVGHYYEHLGLLIAMESAGLIESGEHWVIGVDIEQYEEAESLSGRYMRGLLKDEPDPVAMKAFKRYLGISATPPGEGYTNFTKSVNEYMEKSPFNFPNPLAGLGGHKTVIHWKNKFNKIEFLNVLIFVVLDPGGSRIPL